jgi:hypothetical protein
MLGIEMLEQGDRILGGELKAAEVFGQHRADVGRDPVEELVVRLVDEMVLVA